MGYYALSLSLVGLPFAIAVGVVTGAVSVIPYVGMFIGTSLGMGVALWQFWGDPGWIAAVAAIYAFGTVFGCAAALMAAPLAAIAGVVMRHLIDRYRASALYKDQVEIEGRP